MQVLNAHVNPGPRYTRAGVHAAVRELHKLVVDYADLHALLSELEPDVDAYEAQHDCELSYSRQHQGRMKGRLRQFLLEHLGREHTL